MKRRTNLFYNSGEDSKFLTFSNYTECLTGTFLSTNTKLFPSKFICLNIPNLNKGEFINGLVAYYENKLATLRDYVVNTVNRSLDELNPLSYLLRYLSNNGISNIAYIGDITEQDYNGTFSDTICVINTSKMFSGQIITDNIVLNETNLFAIAEENLRGWYENGTYLGPNNYANINPVFDDQNKYLLTDNNYISVSNTETNSVEFNVIIPTFSLVNTDSVLTENIYSELSLLDSTDNEIHGTSDINVPMGIWFADKSVVLEGDSKYNTSWSLAIGSQFKPFPTSNNINSEITNESNSIAFGTFAQILSRQNDLLSYVQAENARLETRIVALENEILQLKQLHN